MAEVITFWFLASPFFSQFNRSSSTPHWGVFKGELFEQENPFHPLLIMLEL